MHGTKNPLSFPGHYQGYCMFFSIPENLHGRYHAIRRAGKYQEKMGSGNPHRNYYSITCTAPCSICEAPICCTSSLPGAPWTTRTLEPLVNTAVFRSFSFGSHHSHRIKKVHYQVLIIPNAPKRTCFRLNYSLSLQLLCPAFFQYIH